MPVSSISIASAIPDEQIVSRYLALSAVVIILCDSILSFQKEFDIIFKKKFSLPKSAYVLYRYLMVVSILLFFYSTFPPDRLSDDSCRALARAISIIMFSTDSIGHFLVTFRTFTLWDRKPRVLQLLCFGSLAVNAVGLAFLILSAENISGLFIEDIAKGIKSCDALTNPLYPLGIWTSQVVFDVYVVILLLWNVMDRPRLSNKELLAAIFEDGLFLVIVTWGIRIVNVILCTLNNKSLPAISISFTEAIIAAINLHLLLRTFNDNENGKNGLEIELDRLIKG